MKSLSSRSASFCMMEKEFSAVESRVDKFLNETTSSVLRCAIERVGEYFSDGGDIDIEDENILLSLHQDVVQDSVTTDVVAAQADLSDMKSDFEEINKDAIYSKCSRLVEDTLTEVYSEVSKLLESDDFRMTSDIVASRKKLQLLLCIKNSNHLQNFFQSMSVNIIQDVLERMTVNGTAFVEDESGTTSGLDSDIVNNLEGKQGSDSDVVSINDCQNMAAVTPAEDYGAVLSVPAAQNNDSSENGLDTQDSTAEQSFYSIQSESILSKSESIVGSSSGNTGFTTADSVTFTTADEQMYQEQSSEDKSVHVAYKDGMSGNKSVQLDKTEHSTTERVQHEEDDFEVDKTLTDFVTEPRQSTPLARDDNDLEEYPHHFLTADNSTIFLSDDSHQIICNKSETLRKSNDELQVLTDDESSVGAQSSPATISRQSSTFGNITLEFDTEWEPGMQGFKEENKNNQNKEEKRAVILHELSFDEHANLKAPDLLGPVFLAIQDDDDDDDEEEGNGDSVSTRKKLSQSIDDLCEMISEDEADQDLPLRRRAMSLEVKKPSVKAQRQKVPTKEELMRAFQDLRNEILEDKVSDEEMEEEVDENEMRSNERQGSVTDDKENEDTGLPDPTRWQTIVYNGQHKVIDLKLLEPYLKVLTHGGYHHDGGKKTVIVVLTACNLPNKGMKRYSLLMEQLFFFIISTMDILVTSEEYIFVYFHGGTDKNQSPSLSWLKKYYQYISRRLRKSVTKVYVVHPNLWLKSVFRLCRPFLSSNFTRKLRFVKTLAELSSYVKTDFIYIPDEVVRVDPDYKKVHAC